MSDPEVMEYRSSLPLPSDAALYAGIDVGSNTVKMIIADLGGGRATRVYEASLQSRLGEGMVAQTRRLREVPILRTLDAFDHFLAAVASYPVRETVAIGTAALRDAENRTDFLRRVEERSGLKIEVIPGDEEARLSYLAVRRDPQWRDVPRLLAIDIGGGSTEVIQGEAHSDRIADRISVNWGAVKLTESFLKSDPPAVAELAAAHLAASEAFNAVPLSENFTQAETRVVGIGGTVSNLAAIQRGGRPATESMHGYALHADDLEDVLSLLASSPIAERKTFPGLDPRRADIILGGAILLSQALAHLGSLTVEVSTRGLRWGLLYDRFLEPKTQA
jgi:exopolyphosphatase/guanosine-5'-triphosphate,3'-diphosphate pyrophosphatase